MTTWLGQRSHKTWMRQNKIFSLFFFLHYIKAIFLESFTLLRESVGDLPSKKHSYLYHLHFHMTKHFTECLAHILQNLKYFVDFFPFMFFCCEIDYGFKIPSPCERWSFFYKKINVRCNSVDHFYTCPLMRSPLS